MEKYNFICTTDNETKLKLIQNGLQLVSDTNGRATFLNDVSKMNFSLDDKSKLQYTNMLCI